MELGVFTAVTSAKNLRVDKPVSKILVRIDQLLSYLTNETLKVLIERKGGSNVEVIRSNIRLNMLQALSQMGEGCAITKGGKTQFGVDLSDGNSLGLSNDEVLIITLENLKAGGVYEVDVLEMPNVQRSAVDIELKKIVTGETRKFLDVLQYDGIAINNMDKITSIEMTYENGVTCTYGPREFAHLVAENNDLLVGSDITAQHIFGYDNIIALPMDGVSRIEIESDGSVDVDIVLRKEIEY